MYLEDTVLGRYSEEKWGMCLGAVVQYRSTGGKYPRGFYGTVIIYLDE